jgi:hypothetical protein
MLFLRNLSRATFISHGSLSSFPWQALWRDPASEIRRAMVPPVSIEHRGPAQDEKWLHGIRSISHFYLSAKKPLRHSRTLMAGTFASEQLNIE